MSFQFSQENHKTELLKEESNNYLKQKVLTNEEDKNSQTHLKTEQIKKKIYKIDKDPKKRVYIGSNLNNYQSITKNAPKIIGKGFRDFLTQNENEFNLKNIKEYKNFKDVEKLKYVVGTFNDLIQNDTIKKLFKFYLENIFISDLSKTRTWEPWNYLPIIKTYLKGIEFEKIVNQIGTQ